MEDIIERHKKCFLVLSLLLGVFLGFIYCPTVFTLIGRNIHWFLKLVLLMSIIPMTVFTGVFIGKAINRMYGGW